MGTGASAASGHGVAMNPRVEYAANIAKTQGRVSTDWVSVYCISVCISIEYTNYYH